MGRICENVRFSILIFVIAAVSGCNYTRSKLDGTKPLVGEGRFQSIQRNILTPKCVGCHGSSSISGGVDLSTFERLMRDPVVVPYYPEKSKLFTCVKSGWMPKADSPLSNEEVDSIYQWILAGAAEVGDGDPSAPSPSPTPSPTPTPTPPPIKPEPKYSWLLANVFSKPIPGGQSCIECHSGPKPKANVDLTTYQKLMDSEGIMAKPIVAQSPEESGVYDQLVRQKMPPFPTKLSTLEIKAVYDWISKGAENN